MLSELSRAEQPEAIVSIEDAPELVVRWPAGDEPLARGPIPAAAVQAILELFIAGTGEPAADTSPR